MISSKEEKSRHDRVVAEVAHTRMNYPDNDHPGWKTHVNEPTRTVGIATKPESYPDVWVGNEKNEVLIIGEIETEMTINQDETRQWRTYSDFCRGALYLYVPELAVKATWDLLKANNITIAGLRAYSFKNDQIVLRNA